MTGRRYGGADALASGIVDETVAEADVLPRAIAIAPKRSPARTRPTLGALKRGLYAETLRDPGGVAS